MFTDVSVALLLHIQEILGSNLGPETHYPDLGFLWFYSVLPSKYDGSTVN
jgi:hypothetical protein